MYSDSNDSFETDSSESAIDFEESAIFDVALRSTM